MPVSYEIVSVLCGGPGVRFPVPRPRYTTLYNRGNEHTPCEMYQRALRYSESEVLIYVHDDVTIHDPNWLVRVLELFGNPDIVCVGLGGALTLGHPYLYKKPYDIRHMARGSYISNQTDWATHGFHETGSHQVAVVDAFFMAVRWEFLLSIGGWPVHRLTHHCLDLWIACEAARAGKQVWMSGAECTHHGGGSSTKPAYREAKWLQGGSLESDHQEPHVFLYKNYADVLPIMPQRNIR